MEAQELIQLDRMIVDTESGEIVDAVEQATTIEHTVADLPKLGRALRHLARRIEALSQYEKAEVERVTAVVNHERGKLQENYNWILDHSRQLMESDGQKSLHYPGLGRFAFRKGSLVVDISEYEQADDKQKRQTQQAHPQAFTTKTTVTPDKKSIKTMNEGGATVPGFSVVRKLDSFAFKCED